MRKILYGVVASLCWVWFALAAQAEAVTNPSAVTSLLDRIGGTGTSSRFVTLVDETLSEGGKDVFVLTSQDNKPCVKGSSVIAVTTGINWYLNHYAHVNLAWNNLTADLTAVAFPLPSTEEKHVCSVDYRYYLNYCTFSYSMSTWTWERWQKEIDWMALHGINIPLQIVGLDVVWYRLLTEKYGYTHDEASKFVAGPCFQAWWGMNNLEGWGGPNPEWWYKRQEKLSKNICDRMRELGMQPVLPGFCGMVPSDFTAKTGNASNNQGGWCGFTRPYILDPNGEAFPVMAKNYYAVLKEVMGTSEYYSMDPFHEGANTSGIDVPAAYTAIYNALKAANDDIDEKWVIQFWQWSGAQYNVLDKVDKGDLIVLDLFSDAHTHFKDYKGHDAVYCMLHNFGGRTGFFGRLNGVINGFFDSKAAHANIKGIGATPEAIETVPVVYDALFELPWYASKPDPKQWLESYTYSRYGQDNSDAKEAWELLRNSSLNCTSSLQGPMEGVVCARPSLTVDRVSSWGGTGIFYDSQDVILATYKLLQSGMSGENYSYDLTDLTRQSVTDYAYYLLKALNEANSSKNTALFNSRRDAYLQLMLDLDELLNTNKDFIVGRWTNLARGIADEVEGTTEADKDWLELNNARTLITTWGDRGQANGGGLRDYSYRMWGGMMKDYYYPRWKYFFDNNLQSTDWFDMEWKWAHNTDETRSYANTATGNTADVARALFGKYFIPVTLDNGKQYFLFRTMDNDLKGRLNVAGFRGENLTFPFAIPEGQSATVYVDFNGDGTYGEGESTQGESILIPATSVTNNVKAKLELSDGTTIQLSVALKDNITEARTVTVVADDAAAGTVSIQGTDAASVTNTEYLTLTAKANAGYDFLNWTDDKGNVVSSDAEFTYYGAAAATFTAHFVVNKWGSPVEDLSEMGTIRDYGQYLKTITLTQYGEEEEIYTTEQCPDKLFNTVSKQIAVAPGGSFTIDWTDAGGMDYCYLSAYIDMDGDGEFYLDNELLAVKGTHGARNNEVRTGPITVTLPFDVPQGITHLRLRFDGAWMQGYDETTGAFPAKASTKRMVYDVLVNVVSAATKAVTVTVKSGDTGRGTVDANGQPDTYTYKVNEDVVLRAYPVDGYKIEHWVDDKGRVLPKEWMEENNIRFKPYADATITAVFVPVTSLTYGDWTFGYDEIGGKLFITSVAKAGSGALDFTQTNSLGKELAGIMPGVFRDNKDLVNLSLPASCVLLDTYLKTSFAGAFTANATVRPEATIPGNKPWQITLSATTDGSAYNQWGSGLLATGIDALANNYAGGFQLYWAKAGTLTVKVNGGGENKFTTAATAKFAVEIKNDGGGNVAITLWADDKAPETKTFTNVAFNDITTFSYCLPTGIDVTSLLVSDPTLHSRPFDGCSALQSITVDPASEVFASADGNLYDKDLSALLTYAEGKLYTRAYVLQNAADKQYATTNPPANANGELIATGGNGGERVVTTQAALTPAALVRMANVSGKNEIYHYNSKGYYGGKAGGGGAGQQIETLANPEWAGDYTLTKRSEFDKSLSAEVSLACAGFTMSGADSRFTLSETAPEGANASVWTLKEVSALPVSVSDALWTSLCFPVDVIVPAEGEGSVYVATAVAEGKLTLSLVNEGTVIPAGQGFLLTTDEARTVEFPVSYAGVSQSLDNLFDGAAARRTELAAKSFYGLGNISGVGFYLSEGTQVPANKAYLLTSKTGTLSSNALLFDFTTTGISPIEGAGAKPVRYYDLQGRRVLYPTRGIYVTDGGKKVFVP